MWRYIHNSTVLYLTFILIQHVTSCNRVTHECQMHAYLEHSGGGRSLPFDIMQNTEHIFLLYVGIYEPYDYADKDTEGIALCQMGYQPVNFMQSKLLSIGRCRAIGGYCHHLCVKGYKL